MSKDAMQLVPSSLLAALVKIADLQPENNWNDSLVTQARACPQLHGHHDAHGRTTWTTDAPAVVPPKGCACVECSGYAQEQEQGPDLTARMELVECVLRSILDKRPDIARAMMGMG
jgi:hypothetical protein